MCGMFLTFHFEELKNSHYLTLNHSGKGSLTFGDFREKYRYAYLLLYDKKVLY